MQSTGMQSLKPAAALLPPPGLPAWAATHFQCALLSSSRAGYRVWLENTGDEEDSHWREGKIPCSTVEVSA